MPRAINGMKICSKCGEVKPATSEYYCKHKGTKDGLRYQCNVCQSEYYISKYGIYEKKKNIYKDGKVIVTSPKHGTFEVLIDDEDWEKVRQHRWCVRMTHGCPRPVTDILHPDGGWVSYGKQKNGNPRRRRRRTDLYIHTLIMNTPKGMVVDHINGDTLDNRKNNLRVCTITQNTRNKRVQRNNACGYKGVSKDKGNSGRPWAANIKHNGNPIRIGNFKRIKDAAEAYDRKTCEIWDIVSPERMLNFPDRFEEYKTTSKEWEAKLKKLDLEVFKEHTKKYGYKGVQYVPATGKLRKVDRPWYARIEINGKSTQIGHYATAEEAAEMRDRKACEIRIITNPERMLNFPERYEEYMADLKIPQ